MRTCSMAFKIFSGEKRLGHKLLVIVFYIFNHALWYTYGIRTNKMHTFFINDWFDCIIFEMLRTTKISTTGRFVHAGLWYFCHAFEQAVWSTKLLIEMHDRNTINLRVQIFLRLKAWLFATFRRQCNCIQSLMKKVCILMVFITYIHLFLCCVSWVRVRVTSDSCEA